MIGNDRIDALRMVLKQLASDPRTLLIPNLRVALESFDAAIEQLQERDLAILKIQAAAVQSTAAIASELATAILRMNYRKSLHNIGCLDALADIDLERFQSEFAELHS